MALRRSKDAVTAGRHAAAPEAVALAEPEIAVPEQFIHEPAVAGQPRLGEILVQKTRVTHKQVAEALLQQSASGKPIGRLLVQLGALSDRELALSLAEQMQLALVDLSQEQPEPDVVTLLPETIARSQTVVPMMRTGETLVVAVAEPSSQLHQQLISASGLPVTMVVAPANEIQRAIDSSYRALTDIELHVDAFQKAEAGRGRTSP